MIARENRVSALRDYQATGVAFLSQSANALLADEMGLGKTVQVASAIDAIRNETGISRVLIVCPTALRLNWQRELRKWAPHNLAVIVSGNKNAREDYYKTHLPIIIASYGQVRSDIETIRDNATFDLVVLDEAQNIKNATSKTARACRVIKRKRAWALTGTPVENKRDDLISVLGFVKGGLANKSMSRPEIHRAMQPHFLRRQKKDVLPELPPIIEQEIFLNMEGEQLNAYEEARLDVASNPQLSDSSYSTVNILALITSLKKICNFDVASERSCKKDALLPYLTEIISTEKKAIVFSQYVETLRWLHPYISKYGVTPMVYEGSMTEEAKNEVVDRFNDSSQSEILLMSIKSGGAGLNLDSADLVVLYDRWWNPAVEQQAMNRAHRFGRDRVLQVIKFIVQDSVEEKIARIISDKKEIFDQYVNDADETELVDLTRQQLLEILGVNETAAGV